MNTGFSERGLRHLHDVMTSHVERASMPGLIALVAHGGRVHVEVIGTKAFGDAAPMAARDAIFRMASLTKPITAVAAMALVEDGVLELEAAVDELLPELVDRRVLRSLDSASTTRCRRCPGDDP